LILVFLSVVLGGIIYSHFEKWSFFDAVYFSVVTLTTIGYGDLYPVTFVGKLFTIFYVFIGIGLIFLFINKVASNAIKKHPAIKVIENDKKFKEQIKKEEKKEQQ
jgi:voltage-gated potassium channel Kch